MNLLSHLLSMLEYEIHANAATLEQLRVAKGDRKQAERLFAHVQAVRDLWLRRIRRERTTGFEPFPEWTLDESEKVMRAMDAEWAVQLNSADPERLKDTLLYEDTKGGFWSTRACDVLVQVFNHSTHHRGQIAMLLSKGGDEPMRVDFILYHRQKEEE